MINHTRYTRFYPLIYRSWWHCLLHGTKGSEDAGTLNAPDTFSGLSKGQPDPGEYSPSETDTRYYAARPNPGAGIGHQLANWIEGFWYARQFGLNFAHLPFSTPEWERFLGFGEGEVTVAELKKRGWKVRRLPLFSEKVPAEIELNKKIIASYAGRKVVLLAEQDQFYRDQFGPMPELRKKFRAAPARAEDRLLYSKDHFNIAIHVRRGDIMADLSNPNMALRYLSNDYFERVLRSVLKVLSEGAAPAAGKPVHVWFFSQGVPEDYPEFASIPNLHWCLDMGARDSFLHFVFADLLITSRSSFSYKPALLSEGIKVCPGNFWHSYPAAPDWVLCSDSGSFDPAALRAALRS